MMKMILKMRKIMCVNVCLFLFVGFTFQVYASPQKKVKDSYVGKVNMNLSTDGSKELEKLETAYFNIDNLESPNGNDMNLYGDISYGGNEYSINISGELYESISSGKTLIGDMSDSTGNFDVISFEIIPSVDKNNLRVDKALEKKGILQLYLLKKGTREFVMFEIDIRDLKSKFKSISLLDYDKISSLDDITKEHWWINVFEPKEEMYLQKSLLLSTSAVHVDNSYKTITYQDGPSNCYKYTINLKLWANVRDYGTANTAEDTFGFTITGGNYYYNGVLMGGNVLKVFGCVATAVLTNDLYSNIDTYYKVDFGQITTATTGGLTLETKLSVGFDYGPVGGTLSWSPVQTITTIDPPMNINYADAVRGIKVPYYKPLTKVGDSYSLSVFKDKKTLSSISKNSGAVFTFNIGFSPSSIDKLTSGSMVVAAKYY